MTEVKSWTSPLLAAWKLDRQSMRDMNAHDGGDWPNHPVYIARQAQGMLFRSLWKDNEASIRGVLGAEPADSYEKYSDDPAHYTKASEIISMIEKTPAKFDQYVPEPITVEEDSFGARLTMIDSVSAHGENLTIVSVGGHEVVANRHEDGSFRWRAGEICVYVPEGAIIPDDVLQERGYWDTEKDRGLLDGKKRNLVKMRRFAGVESRGLLLKVGAAETPWFGQQTFAELSGGKAFWIDRGDSNFYADIGDDVAEFLGITERKVA